LDDLLFFTLSYFNWTLDNKIQWAPDINWVWTPQNLDQSKGSGWEIGTTVGPFYNLALSLDYTYIDAQEKNQYVTRREAYTPRQLFRGDLSYWTDFGLTATATVRYVGDRVFYGTDKTITEPTNTLASYWTADLRLEQRLFDHWLFSLQASNLFDKDYDTHFGSFTDPTTWQTSTAAFPGAGRSVFFGVSYEF
jgi:iron complex outermembrane receptor protein